MIQQIRQDVTGGWVCGRFSHRARSFPASCNETEKNRKPKRKEHDRRDKVPAGFPLRRGILGRRRRARRARGTPHVPSRVPRGAWAVTGGRTQRDRNSGWGCFFLPKFVSEVPVFIRNPFGEPMCPDNVESEAGPGETATTLRRKQEKGGRKWGGGKGSCAVRAPPSDP